MGACEVTTACPAALQAVVLACNVYSFSLPAPSLLHSCTLYQASKHNSAPEVLVDLLSTASIQCDEFAVIAHKLVALSPPGLLRVFAAWPQEGETVIVTQPTARVRTQPARRCHKDAVHF